jgi:hypothetical protein
MIFNIFASILICSVFAATFNIRDIVLIRGLQTVDYEDRLAIVVGNTVQDWQGQTRVPVIVWMGSNESVPIIIKPENLVSFKVDTDFCPPFNFDPDSSNHLEILEAFEGYLITVHIVVAAFDIEKAELISKLVIHVLLKAFGYPGLNHIRPHLPFDISHHL